MCKGENCELSSVLERNTVFHAVHKTRGAAVEANYALSYLIASHTKCSTKKKAIPVTGREGLYGL
jgi:hypothetical protein